MQPRIIVPFFASLALCASAALAQDAPAAPPAPPPMQAHHMMGGKHFSMEDMQKHRAQMCADLTPRAVGKFAYLEAKLALTDSQKPVFERWKNAVLSSIKAHEGVCLSMKMPDRDASVVDMAKNQQKMMETHLADLRAQMPALEALVGSLNAEQNKILDHAAMRLMHDRAEMMGRMHDMMGPMHGTRGHGGHDADDDAPPPPEQ